VISQKAPKTLGKHFYGKRAIMHNVKHSTPLEYNKEQKSTSY
jgi:hypothetical protein